MMFTTNETDNTYTIDGCLCVNNVTEEYQACMDTVRTRMTTQLDTIFLPHLKSVIETDGCKNYAQNCLVY